MICFEIITGDH